MIEKIRGAVKKHSLVNASDRVVVAVSGGPDSVCLLHVLHAQTAELGITLHIAHLDHMFRGDESAGEALFVADLAKKMNIPATMESIDVPAFCRERGLSKQAGAREVRYGFLQRVAAETGSTRIATGHTADDQAETFLMRLLRGAGMTGLSAIPLVRGNIIRPLLDVTREEILAYLAANSLQFKTDPSNTKPLYTRNRVRLELMPVLKRFNPRIVETLASEAELLRDEDEALDSHLTAYAARIISQDDKRVIVRREEFNALPLAFKRRLLRTAADQAGASSAALSLVLIDSALQFMSDARTGRCMELPPDLTMTREYDRFVLSVKSMAGEFSIALLVPGITALPALGMEVETMLESDRTITAEDVNYLWQADFDYDKIGPLLRLRSRLPGDRFQPAGMGGRSKKIQDFFVDEKIPKRERDRVPLIVSGDDILWVVGRRTDGRFLPSPETKKVLKVTFRLAEPAGYR